MELERQGQMLSSVSLSKVFYSKCDRKETMESFKKGYNVIYVYASYYMKLDSWGWGTRVAVEKPVKRLK